MKFFKGIIHVHSNFSSDGQHSLKEIVHFGKKRGYNFIGMSEHSDTFDKDKMSGYVKKCQMLSDSDLLIIPGLEFTCEDNIHIIGLGIEDYIDSKNTLKVISFIHQQNGIAIIAHPSRNDYKISPELVRMVDGIEVWNILYDGRFVPNIHSLNFIRKLRKENSSILALGGQDLHRITNHINVEIILSCKELNKTVILSALKKGDFKISNSYFQLDSRREIGWLKLMQIHMTRQIYKLAVWVRNHPLLQNIHRDT
jgi:hypothetical protein